MRYRIEGPLRALAHCHCSMCRKVHGTAFGSYGSALRAQFAWAPDTAAALGAYTSSPGVVRHFCRQCGSALAWCSERWPDWISVTLGTLDTPLEPTRMRHSHLDDRADWDPVPADSNA